MSTQLINRARRLLSRKVVVWVRQSTVLQRKQNTGSTKLQETMPLNSIRALGFLPEQIETISVAESGRVGAKRKEFLQLLDLVASGEIGLVAVMRGDRLGRSSADTNTLYDAAASQKAMFLFGDRLFDPSDSNDRMILEMQATLAQWENESRRTLMILTRMAKAREGAYRIPLPTGLVWASPTDSGYVERLTAVGLSDWLDKIPDHQIRSRRQGHDLYVLPFPDAALMKSIELRLSWFLSTGSLQGVIEKINTSPEWPHPGKLPQVYGFLYRQDQEVVWKEYFVQEEMRWALRTWFESPAVYGTYQVGFGSESRGGLR